MGRLINHDLEGNVVSKLHSINGQPYIVFFAKRDIKKGEEIAYDYNDQRKDVTENLLWWDPKKGKKKITNDTTFTKGKFDYLKINVEKYVFPIFNFYE